MPKSICKKCDGTKQRKMWNSRLRDYELKNCSVCLGRGEVNMLEPLQDFDWEEAFKYAEQPIQVPFTESVDLAGFKREDIEEIVALSEGTNDEENWIAVFKLTDGRVAFLDAGCDYTGWGCREWGESEVCGTLEDMIRYGLTDTHRQRLNLPLEGDSK